MIKITEEEVLLECKDSGNFKSIKKGSKYRLLLEEEEFVTVEAGDGIPRRYARRYFRDSIVAYEDLPEITATLDGEDAIYTIPQHGDTEASEEIFSFSTNTLRDGLIYISMEAAGFRPFLVTLVERTYSGINTEDENVLRKVNELYEDALRQFHDLPTRYLIELDNGFSLPEGRVGDTNMYLV